MNRENNLFWLFRCKVINLNLVIQGGGDIIYLFIYLSVFVNVWAVKFY